MKFVLIFYGTVFIAFGLGAILKEMVADLSGWLYLGVGFGLLLGAIIFNNCEEEDREREAKK